MWENKEGVSTNIAPTRTAWMRLKEYTRDEGLDIIACASAPGRVDFLNTHQDYKGLPVVPIAINMRVYACAVEELGDRFIVESLDLRSIEEFPINELGYSGGFGDYLKACVAVLREYMGVPVAGYRVIISSDIPVGGGMGSSGALEVCFIKLLASLLGVDLGPDKLAEMAFQAENRKLGVPCGRLDQYASSYGGVILLHPKPPVRVERLGCPPLDILVVDSGIRHKTKTIHSERRKEIMEGVSQLLCMDLPKKLREKLQGGIEEIMWWRIREEELNPYINWIEEKYARRIIFTIRMNRLTEIAVKILKNEGISRAEYEYLCGLGMCKENREEILMFIVNKQHELLRDLYNVSLPKIEDIIQSAISAGARAAKISGAGLGGCIIVFVEKEKIDDVSEACMNAGAKNIWHVNVDVGARLETMGG